MSTRRIDARIPQETYDEIRKLDVSVSRSVCDALNMYLHTDVVRPAHDDGQYTRHLEDEIVFLRDLNSKMSARVFMLPEDIPGNALGTIPRHVGETTSSTPTHEKKHWWTRLKHG